MKKKRKRITANTIYDGRNIPSLSVITVYAHGMYKRTVST